MISKIQLAEIAARNQERPNKDVTTLLAEVHELKSRQIQAIRWIGRDVLPNLREVRRYLLYRKPPPKEYLALDTATAKLEEHLGWLGLPLEPEQ
ncbi:MAG: hypothetical protein WBL65_27125 [Bryobacteraceae bacterium]